MFTPQENLKAQLVEFFTDLIAEWTDNDEFTGRLLEEALLEALENNASYFSTELKKANKLINDYKNIHHEKQEEILGCSSECDI